MTAFWMVGQLQERRQQRRDGADSQASPRSPHGSCFIECVKFCEEATPLTKLGGTGGAVESDETFIGAESARRCTRAQSEVASRFAASSGAEICTLARLPSSECLTATLARFARKVIPNVRRETLQNEILKNVEYGSKVYTDSCVAYDNLGKTLRSRSCEPCDASTSAGRFTRTGWRTSGACSSATCAEPTCSVEPFHLDRYLDEQVFRFNNRGGKKPEERVTDSDRFISAMSLPPASASPMPN